MQHAPFLVVLVYEITMYLIMKWTPLSLYCGDYSYQHVTNKEGATKRSLAPAAKFENLQVGMVFS